jgi:hypothetical protein
MMILTIGLITVVGVEFKLTPLTSNPRNTTQWQVIGDNEIPFSLVL